MAKAVTVSFGPDTRDQLDALAIKAADNPIDVGLMLELFRTKTSISTVRPDQGAELDGGWMVFYTVEDHPQSDGKPRRMRHVSISHKDLKTPPDLAVSLIIQMLGYQLPYRLLLSKGSAYTETTQDDMKRAINVLEPLDLSGLVE